MNYKFALDDKRISEREKRLKAKQSLGNSRTPSDQSLTQLQSGMHKTEAHLVEGPGPSLFRSN